MKGLVGRSNLDGFGQESVDAGSTASHHEWATASGSFSES